MTTISRTTVGHRRGASSPGQLRGPDVALPAVADSPVPFVRGFALALSLSSIVWVLLVFAGFAVYRLVFG